jgi:hypothetical protein
VNPARTAWIAVGAVVLTLGIGLLGMPVFVGMFGAPVDLGLAFVLATIADLILVGVYVAGILVARRDAAGRGRALPPALALAVIVVGVGVAYGVITTVATR